MQFTQRHWQPEAFWPSASRIEEQHTILDFALWNVSVAVNHGGKSRCFRLEIEFLQDVNDVNCNARNFQTKHVAFLEDVARGPNINREFVNLPGIDQRGCFLRIPIAGAENSFSQVLREAVGPDVNQLSREIGIDRRGFGV